MVGCFGLNGPLRQYFSLYQAVSQRGRKKREMIDERKNVQTTQSTPTASAVGPCLTIIQISRTPRHWMFTKHHCTTRPPPTGIQSIMIRIIRILRNFFIFGQDFFLRMVRRKDRQRDLATFLRAVALSFSAFLELALGSSANVRLAKYARFSSHYTDPFCQPRYHGKIDLQTFVRFSCFALSF